MNKKSQIDKLIIFIIILIIIYLIFYYMKNGKLPF